MRTHADFRPSRVAHAPAARRGRRLLLLLAAAVGMAAFSPLQNAAAADPQTPSLQDLIDVQQRVQAVLDASDRTLVAIECGSGTASGVIVSADGLVLTAAHVTSGSGKKYKITLHDGRSVEGTSLGLDTTTDAAMLQLPAPAKTWPHAPISRETHVLTPGAWCFAIGHPGGFDKARGRVLRIGRLVKISSNMMQSDCVLMAGDSGGPLFNLDGEVIGIHSQIWQGRDQNLHVSMAPFLRNWDAMKRGDTIRMWNQGSGGWIGLSTHATPAGLAIRAIAPDSPAAGAGLAPGDVILSVNNQPTAAPVDFSDIIRRRPAGEVVTLRILNQGRERLLPIKLQPRPED